MTGICCMEQFVQTKFDERGQVFQSLSVEHGLLFERCINPFAAKTQGTDKRCYRQRTSVHRARSSLGPITIAPALHAAAQVY